MFYSQCSILLLLCVCVCVCVCVCHSYLPIVWSGTLAFYLRWLLEEGGRVVQVAGAMVGWPAANTLPALVAAPPVVTLLQVRSHTHAFPLWCMHRGAMH